MTVLKETKCPAYILGVSGTNQSQPGEMHYSAFAPPAVVHVDETTRPQMVRRTVNPYYYDMTKRLGEKTGLPIMINTSLNLKGEPVVNSSRDAVRIFYSSGLDALAMGSFIIEK